MIGMTGLGYRREMAGWDMAAVEADFFEVAPENWLRRDRAPLHALRASGRAVQLHGVTLNLGGHSALDRPYLRSLRELIDELGVTHCSDHLAASGDEHQLHDLFPLPFTPSEVIRVSDRIRRVQDALGHRIAVENTTWYTNTGDLPEPDFLMAVAERADCNILLDLNNIDVNHKNHGRCAMADFIAAVDLRRVAYLHVAGHEYDPRFGLHVDTHGQAVPAATARAARHLAQAHGLPVLLERDHDLPDLDTLNRELACLRPTSSPT